MGVQLDARPVSERSLLLCLKSLSCEYGSKSGGVRKIAVITADAAKNDFEEFQLIRQNILKIMEKSYC